MFLFTPLFLLILFLLLLYKYFTRNFDHWKNKNVNFLKPLPFVGNAKDVFLLRKSIGDICHDMYFKSEEPFVGLFICDKPYLLINDLDLIKSVLIKDFSIFNDRSISDNKKVDPMGSHILFIMKNPDWKEMRRKISPAFTTGKMKLMYNLIKESGEEMLDYLSRTLKYEGKVLNTRDLAAKYTTDAITSTSFGIKANCFRNENAEFRKVSEKVFNWKYLERAIATTCYFVSPTLVKLFRLKFIDYQSATFLRKAFWSTMQERERTKFVRNDLLDILIEIRKNEDIQDLYKLEGDKLVAQATQFFIAGFETTSTTISFTLYELALNKKLQNELREEIQRVKQKYQEFTYDALKEMDLLDRCIKETLRKYPPLPFLDRRCMTDYQIPNTEIILEKGTPIFISVLGLHYDPKYFPNPTVYDPDRFLEDNEINPMTYLPFGDGPRNCIGARFGTLSSKSGVAHIISEFEVEVCDQTQNPMTFDPKGFLVAPIGGLPLKVTKLCC